MILLFVGFGGSVLLGGCRNPASTTQAPDPNESDNAAFEPYVAEIEVAPGSFIMGNQNPEAPQGLHQRVERPVTITQRYAIGVTPITCAQWTEVMQTAPCLADAPADAPVHGVSWVEAALFLNALSEQQGLDACYVMDCTTRVGAGCDEPGRCVDGGGCAEVDFAGLQCNGYRFPTEAEWEYAARAGLQESLYGELEAIAWTRYDALRVPPSVGQRTANAWGLYDTVGLVWEWVHDIADDFNERPAVDPMGPEAPIVPRFRVLRGGSMGTWPRRLSLGLRQFAFDYQRGSDIGFRVARSLQ